MRTATPHLFAPAAPLGPLLVFAALNSAGTGTATMGIFFLTKSAFAFSTAANYALGVLMGVTYIVGALASGPLLRALLRRGGLEPRGALLAGTLLFALACLLPWTVQRPWAVFALAALYMPISGAFWPIVESYVSGGRVGANLHRSIGRFNVVWSGSLALAFWIVAPLVAKAPLDVFLVLAIIHAASLLFLKPLPSRPGRVEPVPAAVAGPGHPALLAIHRPLLAASYLALFAFSPYLPVVLTALDVAPAWHTPLASIWMAARVAGFFVFERWHGWHGRIASAVAGVLSLIFGFALGVLAPLAPSSIALGVFVVGLLAFGAGAALLYTAALAYALEHGAAEIEAGGSHEALIGGGYALGPLTGLAVLGAVELGVLPKAQSEAALTATVALLVLGAAAWAWRASASLRREAALDSPQLRDDAPPVRHV